MLNVHGQTVDVVALEPFVWTAWWMLTKYNTFKKSYVLLLYLYELIALILTCDHKLSMLIQHQE